MEKNSKILRKEAKPQVKATILNVNMWKDEIVEEIRKNREELSKKHNYNPKKLFSSLKTKEKNSDKKAVSLQPKLTMKKV